MARSGTPRSKAARSTSPRQRPNLRLRDPPLLPHGVDQRALRALGLHEFAGLRLPSSGDQAKQLIAEFVAFFHRDHDATYVRRRRIKIDESSFRAALRLPSQVLAQAPAGVDATALRATAHAVMDA
ncbi:hypothetical protein ACP70R_014495 [Stipagrostis hirtigluma subsp. patula]